MVKKRVIYSLVIVAVILLLINIIVEFISTPEVIIVNNEIKTSQIEEIFISSLWTHGILEQWISAKVIDNAKYDSLKQVYYVDIPKDLQVVSVISGLSENFAGKPVKLVTEERVNHSNSTVKIYSNGVLKLEAFINQSDKIRREFSEITMIVKSGGSLDEEQQEKLKKVKISYTLLYTPTEDLLNEMDLIKKYSSSIAVLISNDIDDDKYEMEADANKSKLSRNVVNLISDYGRNRAYILDEQAEIYSSVAFPYVRDEFNKRGIELKRLSDFVDLRGKPLGQVKSILKFHCDNGKGKQRRFLIVGLDDFFGLQQDIEKYRKLGNKFFAL